MLKNTSSTQLIFALALLSLGAAALILKSCTASYGAEENSTISSISLELDPTKDLSNTSDEELPASFFYSREDLDLKEVEDTDHFESKVKRSIKLKRLKQAIIAAEEQGCDLELLATLYTQYGDALLDEKDYSASREAFIEAEEQYYTATTDQEGATIATLYPQQMGTLSVKKLLAGFNLEKEHSKVLQGYAEDAKKYAFSNYESLLYHHIFQARLEENIYATGYLYAMIFEDNQQAMFDFLCYLTPQSKKGLSVDVGTLFPKNIAYKSDEAQQAAAKAYQKLHPSIPSYFDPFIEGLMDDLYSRSGGASYQLEQLVKAEHFISLIYATEIPWGELVLPKTYHLVTFDYEGNILATAEIGKTSYKGYQTFTYSPDHSIKINDFEVVWDEKAKEEYEENFGFFDYTDIVKTKFKGEKQYQISEKGELVLMDKVAKI